MKPQVCAAAARRVETACASPPTCGRNRPNKKARSRRPLPSQGAAERQVRDGDGDASPSRADPSRPRRAPNSRPRAEEYSETRPAEEPRPNECPKGALQTTRALMIVSIIVTLAGLGVACMGMKCTNCGGDDKTRKSRIALTGGIIILIGSLCAIVACSWYAHDIIQAFYNPFTPVNTKYEFGSAIFIAWAGSFLAVVGGAMLAATCPKSKSTPKYPISRPPSSKEYV
uniref:Claudin 7b n=1 Tax=Lateolabrax maculatus TaxID=315492 RepID=A0A8X8M3Y6_LATMC|nr:claudin 7b [Lateolabrax maculatus]